MKLKVLTKWQKDKMPLDRRVEVVQNGHKEIQKESQTNGDFESKVELPT